MSAQRKRSLPHGQETKEKNSVVHKSAAQGMHVEAFLTLTEMNQACEKA